MSDPKSTPLQQAELTISKPLAIRAKVQVSPAGLLSIAALVSSILLSTAALVWVAKQK